MEAQAVLRQLDEVIAAADQGERAGLVVQLASRLASLGAQLSAAPVERSGENITIAEGAKRLGVSCRYLYRHGAALPFVVKIGRRRLVNEGLLEAFVRRRGA